MLYKFTAKTKEDFEKYINGVIKIQLCNLDDVVSNDISSTHNMFQSILSTIVYTYTLNAKSKDNDSMFLIDKHTLDYGIIYVYDTIYPDENNPNRFRVCGSFENDVQCYVRLLWESKVEYISKLYVSSMCNPDIEYLEFNFELNNVPLCEYPLNIRKHSITIENMLF